MIARSLAADLQTGGDASIVETSSDQLQHLPFARGQLAESSRSFRCGRQQKLVERGCEFRPGRFVLLQDVIAALQRHEARIRGQARAEPLLLEG